MIRDGIKDVLESGKPWDDEAMCKTSKICSRPAWMKAFGKGVRTFPCYSSYSLE